MDVPQHCVCGGVRGCVGASFVEKTQGKQREKWSLALGKGILKGLGLCFGLEWHAGKCILYWPVKNAISVSFSQPLNGFITFSESSKQINVLRLGGWSQECCWSLLPGLPGSGHEGLERGRGGLWGTAHPCTCIFGKGDQQGDSDQKVEVMKFTDRY